MEGKVWYPWLLLLLCGGAQCYRVVIFSTHATSHCLELAGVARGLLARGHQVTFYTPDYFDHKHCVGDLKVEVISYTTSPEVARDAERFGTDLSQQVFQESHQLWSLVPLVKVAGTAFCQGLLASGLDKLRGKFDFAVAHAAPIMRCLALVPAYLDIPMALEGIYIDSFDSFSPFPGAFFPNFMVPHARMDTFFGRLGSTLVLLCFRAVELYLSSLVDKSQFGLGERFESLSETQCVREAALYLDNSDFVLDTPRAAFPNHIMIGAISARPAKPLGGELQRFLDGAKEGVVVVSFGSILKYAPRHVMEALMGGLKRLKVKVLLKLDKNGQEGNVKFVTWMSQNDVLGHNNTRLFMSHCGKNSVLEAIYHGVPILGTPLNGDADYNVHRLVEKGVGLRLDLKTATADDVYNAASALLADPAYSRRMKTLSGLLRDRPQMPGERAARAIELVLQYGSAHLRPPVATQLNGFQMLLLDVWLFLLLVVVLVVVLVVSLVVCVVRCVCCRRRGKVVRPKTD